MSNKLKYGYGFGGILEQTVPVDLRDTFSSHISFQNEDERWMHEALLTAMHQIGLPPPNPTVGCVIVKDGKKITTGATERFGGLHAERSAIKNMVDRTLLKGATAYVTLEPCCHHGKQPPCTDALIEAGIGRCVIAAGDLHHLVAGGGIAALTAAGCQITVGPLRNEAIAFNYPFFAAQVLKRPVFIGKWAQTIDGLLADDDSSARWISSVASRAYTHWLRQKFDAIMVGAGTLLADVPSLNVRSCADPINRHPLKIIFDPSGRLVLSTSADLRQKIRVNSLCPPVKAIYAISDKAYRQALDQSLWKAMQWNDSTHIMPLILRDEDPVGDLVEQLGSAAVTNFHTLPLQSIFIEGGGALLNLFMSRDLIDCFHTFIAPAFLGASRHRIGAPVNEEIPSALKKPWFPQKCPTMHRHRLMTAQPLGEDVLMEYIPEDRFAKIF